MSYYQRPKQTNLDTGRRKMQRVIVFRHFSRTASVVLSLGQVALGLGCMGVQITGIALNTISTHLGATGIWAGIFIIFAGISGFVAAKFRVPGAIISFMVLSVIAAIVAPAIVVTSTISIMEQASNCIGIPTCKEEEINERKVVDVALIVLATLEYFLASSCVITCCWTLYCDPAGYQFEFHDNNRKSVTKNVQGNAYQMDQKYESQVEDGFSAIEEEEEPDDESDRRSQNTEKEDIEMDSFRRSQNTEREEIEDEVDSYRRSAVVEEVDEEEQEEEVHERGPDIEEDNEDEGITNRAFDGHMSEQSHIDAA